jgi:ATP-dependent Zn protease
MKIIIKIVAVSIVILAIVIPASFSQESPYKTWSYSQFIQAVQNEEIQKVFFSRDRSQLYAWGKAGNVVYVSIPYHPELVKLLLQKNVEIIASNPNESSSEKRERVSRTRFGLIINIIIVFFLILIVVVLLKNYQKIVGRALHIAEEQLNATRENNQLLKEIIKRQNQINQTLEKLLPEKINE